MQSRDFTSRVKILPLLTKRKVSDMQTTAQLLEHALKTRPAKFWCDRYYIRESTISTAKKRGRLSPVLAGNLAYDLGEDVTKWMAIAATETERETPMSERLRDLLLRTKP